MHLLFPYSNTARSLGVFLTSIRKKSSVKILPQKFVHPFFLMSPFLQPPIRIAIRRYTVRSGRLPPSSFRDFKFFNPPSPETLLQLHGSHFPPHFPCKNGRLFLGPLFSLPTRCYDSYFRGRGKSRDNPQFWIPFPPRRAEDPPYPFFPPGDPVVRTSNSAPRFRLLHMISSPSGNIGIGPHSFSFSYCFGYQPAAQPPHTPLS